MRRWAGAAAVLAADTGALPVQCKLCRALGNALPLPVSTLPGSQEGDLGLAGRGPVLLGTGPGAGLGADPPPSQAGLCLELFPDQLRRGSFPPLAARDGNQQRRNNG